MDIAVVGDRHVTSVFRLVGIHAVEVEDENSAVSGVRELAERSDVKVLFVTEKVATKIEDVRDKLLKENRSYPVFVIIPDFDGPLGYRKQQLHEFVNRSMGIRLKVGN